MLWHDPTKVGNYDEGIRIPEPVYQRLDARRTKTLQLFEKLALIPMRSSATCRC
ncbi:hypothetical protein ABZ797_16410 [Streptomyces antimycoticus]|uniref:hypothetical protein n=1 Tax=Streptomyces antimycoticus TaxID=68175 RepID=UPI00340130F2|nr:hypothetical protein OG546_37905 [Streptomyces antimycoticus]